MSSCKSTCKLIAYLQLVWTNIVPSCTNYCNLNFTNNTIVYNFFFMKKFKTCIKNLEYIQTYIHTYFFKLSKFALKKKIPMNKGWKNMFKIKKPKPQF